MHNNNLSIKYFRFINISLLALLIGCESESHGEFEPPEPYEVPEKGAPVCELSADCPDGTFCDLGQCNQVCNVDEPCENQAHSCNERGRCLESRYAPTDPQPKGKFLARVVATESVLFVDKEITTATFFFEAQPSNQTLRYRVEPQVSWIECEKPRGEFEGFLDVSLTINRQELEPGENRGVVTLYTDAGAVPVTLIVQQSMTGVYNGQIEYKNPRYLGVIPIQMDIIVNDQFADIKIDSQNSPTFPSINDLFPTTTAIIRDGQITGSLIQRLEDEQLGDVLGKSFLKRPIGRIFRFSLSTQPSGGLAGTFTERWVGIFSEEAKVSGQITLSPVAGKTPAPFSLSRAAELPRNPSVNSPNITNLCSQAAGTAELNCSLGLNSFNAVSCAQSILDVGQPWKDKKLFNNTGNKTNPYTFLADACNDELSNSSEDYLYPIANSDSTECVHIPNLDCALQFFGRAARTGSQDGFKGLNQVVADRAELGLLVANEALVKAYETPFKQAVGIETTIVEHFDKARNSTFQALEYIFNPYLLEMLKQTRPSTAAQINYRGLRRLAQLLAVDRTAADQKSGLLLRTRPSERSALLEEINKDGPALLVALVTLSIIEDAQGAPSTPEVSLFAQTLTQLGRRNLEAQDAFNPLGLPNSYIPFVFDTSTASPERSTNFNQVFNNHIGEVTVAVALENEASTTMRDFDFGIQALKDELTRLQAETDMRLLQLCGPTPGDVSQPNLQSCGEKAGEIAVAQSQILEEKANIDIAMTRMEALAQRVRIQHQRLQEVQGIRAETIAFVDKTYRHINVLEHINIALDALREFTAISSNSGMGSPGAAAGGAVVAILSYAQGRIRIQQDKLRQAQEMKRMQSEADVEYINGMAVIKEMLVGMTELELEATYAMVRLATAHLRYDNLVSEVQSMEARQEIMSNNILDDLSNDASFRVLRGRKMLRALSLREKAQRGMYLAARAFEYETNTELPFLESHLVGALTAQQIQDFAHCLESAFISFRESYGVPTQYDNEISLREDILGITATIKDDLTGEIISEGEQFRRLLLHPQNIKEDGTVALTFVTTLNPGNGLFNTNVCNDQIRSLQVKLIGDHLGDNEASIVLRQEGSTLMRSCESGRNGQGDIINEYSITPSADTVIQAGVNDYPQGAGDTQLFGRSVAATEWTLSVPPGTMAPTNSDLDFMSLEDIILRIGHSAISLSGT